MSTRESEARPNSARPSEGRLEDERYNVLMVAPTSFFSDYGGHIRILEEARILQKLGHRVTVLTYYLGQDVPGLEIIRTRPTPWRADYEVGSSLHKLAFDVLLGWTGLRTVLRRRFDIVHGHMHEGALVGYFLSRILQVPLVFDFQGSLTGEMVDHGFLDEDGPFYRWVSLLEHRIAQLPDVVVTSSGRGAELLEAEFNCQGDCLVALPDCVDLDFFRPDVIDQSTLDGRKEELGIPPGRQVVVYLGLLAEYQGTPLLVKTAKELKDRGTEVHFLVMGFPNALMYRQMAADLGVDDRMIFTGKVPYDQAPSHLALGDIAIAPKMSETEGAGKILNYMAMGLPTIAFDNPVSREYLADLGVYADPAGGHMALADAVTSLLGKTKANGELGRRLRELARSRFSWDRTGRILEEVYSTLLADPSRRGRKARRS